MVLNGSLVILMQITRFIALRYESASSLQKMAFLTAVYSFTFDILLFGVNYTTLQVVGLVTVLVLYVWQLFYFTWWEKRNEKKKEEEETEQPVEVAIKVDNRYSVNVEALQIDISSMETASSYVT